MLSYTYSLGPVVRALSVLQLNKPVTPEEISKAVGSGNYAAKYVMLLNKYYGFTVTGQRDGRRIVSYTLVAEPANAAEIRNAQPAPKGKGKSKAKAVAKAVKAAPAPKKSSPRKSPRVRDEVEETFGSSGVMSAIDPDWDSVDGLNIKQLL